MMNVHAPGGAPAGTKALRALPDKMLHAIPLGSVVSGCSLQWEEPLVRRLNGQRAMEAECDPDPDNPEATPDKVMRSIRPAIEAIPLPEGYHLRWVGEGEVQGQAIGNLMKYVPLTMFIILAILLGLTGSWRKVGVILLCLPLPCAALCLSARHRQPLTLWPLSV